MSRSFSRPINGAPSRILANKASLFLLLNILLFDYSAKLHRIRQITKKRCPIYWNTALVISVNTYFLCYSPSNRVGELKAHAIVLSPHPCGSTCCTHETHHHHIHLFTSLSLYTINQSFLFNLLPFLLRYPESCHPVCHPYFFNLSSLPQGRPTYYFSILLTSILQSLIPYSLLIPFLYY